MTQASLNIELLYDLKQFLTDYFNLEEIRMLCFKLGVNYENLPGGEVRSRKARELIIHLGELDGTNQCEKHFQDLLEILQDERSAFYPNLFEKLGEDERSDPENLPAAALAKYYCAGFADFMRATRPLPEKALSRIGLENRVGIAIGIIILLLVSVVIGASYLLWRQVRPDQMSGDFNIAVAPFYVIGEEQSIGQDVANSIFGRLQANFGDRVLPLVDVWGPDEPLLNPVPVVNGATDDIRDANAARLADEINADIVVYGVVVRDDNGWKVTPKFYVSPNNFENASEILGPYDLGETFSLVEGNRRALRITAGDKLTYRAELLTQVAIGLTYYSIANYDRTAATLLAILPDEEDAVSAEEDSLRLVYLLLGNTMLKKALQQVAAMNSSNSASIEAAESRLAQYLLEAESYFTQSAAIDSEYSRAFVGLGDIAYQQSFQCDAAGCGVDVVSLTEAISYYERALAAENSPKTAVINAKVYFGLGQVYYRQSTVDNGASIDDAISNFEAVITDYQGGESPRARDIAAEAQARLGLIYCYQGRFDDAVDSYRRALDLYANDPAQETNRLLSRNVRAQRSELFQFRVTMLESGESPNCSGVP